MKANLPTSFESLSGIKLRSYLGSYWLSRSIVEEHHLASDLLELESEPSTRAQAEEATNLLRSNLTLHNERMTNVLNISFRSENPEQAAVMIQRYLDRLDRYLREQTISRAESNAQYLEQVTAPIQDKELIERMKSIILAQYEQIAYARAAGNYLFETLEPPHPSYIPVGYHPVSGIVGGASIGLALAAFFAITRQIKDKT